MIFRRVVGAIGLAWAIIGVGNIVRSPMIHQTGPDQVGAAIVLLFNAVLFVLPGLALGTWLFDSRKKTVAPKMPESHHMQEEH